MAAAQWRNGEALTPIAVLRRVAVGLAVGALVLLPILLLALGAATLLAVQDAPQVSRVVEVSVLDLARGMRLLRAADPRRQTGQGPRELSLTQREVELLADLAAQRSLPAATRLTLAAQTARLQISLKLQGTGFSALDGRWLNIDASLRETAALPVIERLRLGELWLPGFVGEWAVRWAVANQLGAKEARLLREVPQGVAFAPDKLTLRYLWRAGTTDQVFALLLPKAEQDRMRAYLQGLAGLKLKSVAGDRIALSQLLAPLFSLAQQRVDQGGEAVAECRAAILALAFVPYPQRLHSVVPAAKHWRLPPRWRLTLAGRDDFPLHFIISAALAVEAGGPLADTIGVFKEVLDAGDGSGFSFNDIAADQAGRRFGQLATRAPARLLALAAGVADSDLLPDVSDLPEFLRAAEFKARYGGLGSPAYQQQLADIEARLNAMPLYRAGP